MPATLNGNVSASGMPIYSGGAASRLNASLAPDGEAPWHLFVPRRFQHIAAPLHRYFGTLTDVFGNASKVGRCVAKPGVTVPGAALLVLEKTRLGCISKVYQAACSGTDNRTQRGRIMAIKFLQSQRNYCAEKIAGRVFATMQKATKKVLKCWLDWRTMILYMDTVIGFRDDLITREFLQ